MQGVPDWAGEIGIGAAVQQQAGKLPMRVGGGNLPELVGIVDDGREEVHGLDERETVGQPEDSRVIEGLATDEDSGIGSRVQRREGAGKVTRTQLGGSTGAAGEGRLRDALSSFSSFQRKLESPYPF